MDPSDDRPCELPVDSLRRLARGLLFERGSADDVVQEAWLAALQARGEIRGLGAWLAGAVRRLAQNRAREEHRRGQRERLAARAEAQPSAAEASARIEILQRLLAAVDRLPSPYREAIVLRYFDDLPPRGIARRLGVPVNTARTHVRRGLERLRAELDPGPGREREAMLAALVPLLGPRAESDAALDPLSPASKTAPMQHPLFLATSAVALGTLAWLLARPGAPDPGAASPNLALLTGASEPSSAVAPASEPETRGPAQGQEVPAPSGRTEAASAWTVRGQVTRGGWDPYAAASLVGRVFAGGHPEGVPLSEEHFQADEQGAFAWAPTTPEGLFAVEVRAALAEVRAWPVHAWFLPGDPPPENLWLDLYPPDTTLRGIVRGPDRAPLADARVALRPGDEARAVRSAADGSFALAYASALAPLIVCAWKDGLAPGLAEIMEPVPGSEHVHEITLLPELRLHGTVRDTSGTPIAGAQVTVMDQSLPAASSEVQGSGEVVMETSAPARRGVAERSHGRGSLRDRIDPPPCHRARDARERERPSLARGVSPGPVDRGQAQPGLLARAGRDRDRTRARRRLPL